MSEPVVIFCDSELDPPVTGYLQAIEEGTRVHPLMVVSLKYEEKDYTVGCVMDGYQYHQLLKAYYLKQLVTIKQRHT